MKKIIDVQELLYEIENTFKILLTRVCDIFDIENTGIIVGLGKDDTDDINYIHIDSVAYFYYSILGVAEDKYESVVVPAKAILEKIFQIKANYSPKHHTLHSTVYDVDRLEKLEIMDDEAFELWLRLQ